MNYRMLRAKRPLYKNVGGRLFERVNKHARMLANRVGWQADLAQRWQTERLLAATELNAVEIRRLHERRDALDVLLEQTALTRKPT